MCHSPTMQVKEEEDTKVALRTKVAVTGSTPRESHALVVDHGGVELALDARAAAHGDRADELGHGQHGSTDSRADDKGTRCHRGEAGLGRHRAARAHGTQHGRRAIVGGGLAARGGIGLSRLLHRSVVLLGRCVGGGVLTRRVVSGSSVGAILGLGNLLVSGRAVGDLLGAGHLLVCRRFRVRGDVVAGRLLLRGAFLLARGALVRANALRGALERIRGLVARAVHGRLGALRVDAHGGARVVDDALRLLLGTLHFVGSALEKGLVLRVRGLRGIRLLCGRGGLCWVGGLGAAGDLVRRALHGLRGGGAGAVHGLLDALRVGHAAGAGPRVVHHALGLVTCASHVVGRALQVALVLVDHPLLEALRALLGPVRVALVAALQPVLECLLVAVAPEGLFLRVGQAGGVARGEKRDHRLVIPAQLGGDGVERVLHVGEVVGEALHDVEGVVRAVPRVVVAATLARAARRAGTALAAIGAAAVVLGKALGAVLELLLEALDLLLLALGLALRELLRALRIALRELLG
mmetsp:Transcript_11703/g.39993  ORF Transcript_11703/g.39993 Transcript_11703/m.39993 type:complete len:523 (-) Transcript_11703:245-1813(-)